MTFLGSFFNSFVAFTFWRRIQLLWELLPGFLKKYILCVWYASDNGYKRGGAGCLIWQNRLSILVKKLICGFLFPIWFLMASSDAVDSVVSLCPPNHNWRIKVCVIRMWIADSLDGESKLASMELILLDQHVWMFFYCWELLIYEWMLIYVLMCL